MSDSGSAHKEEELKRLQKLRIKDKENQGG
jgi:hypothetical protein